MNIEVGEYIRTKQGNIDKVILEYTGKCANPNCSAKHISCKLNYYDEEDIISHSKNIIDLIEPGDYVNGDKIVPIDYTEDENGNYIDVLGIMEIEDDYAYPIELRVLNIKSIVTKEQFKNMEYKV